ncbi:hypothetical protein CHS0354_029419 [Potamilus streckersoni]|uniref:Uncharacterized protein n=1 Tax=Potamilus streckersoni TaxID=2493646 RepID=A0AAE0SUL2_9BIVA|nr:hypothetical protein CHS0354_029419 [Potamilus streckersoni]
MATCGERAIYLANNQRTPPHLVERYRSLQKEKNPGDKALPTFEVAVIYNPVDKPTLITTIYEAVGCES